MAGGRPCRAAADRVRPAGLHGLLWALALQTCPPLAETPPSLASARSSSAMSAAPFCRPPRADCAVKMPAQTARFMYLRQEPSAYMIVAGFTG